ncbi:MAG: 3-deoxy-7-phosphoheptulonate synthase [Deltaproteobacteria bacterium]|nr:3-deoxy-7-phosphoheptulonate synthase [Deltaproteobacteria bacterium]
MSHGVSSGNARLVSRSAQGRPSCVSLGETACIGDGHFLLVAGPCAVESREQLLASARAARDAGAGALRGGAFKPRTSPYDFQGLGAEGLLLLAEAREATGLPIVTEVLDPRDMPLVAEYADVIQIGSRNTQNYPLLREAGHARRPVLLKRGMSMTIREWLCAAEYIVSEGNSEVILCERGIRTFETATRHTLDLNAIPVLKALTHLPVMVDPSHGTGHAAYVPSMAKAAVAAGADGLLIEIHPDPRHALSDGAQSLDFPTFARLAHDIAHLRATLAPQRVRASI